MEDSEQNELEPSELGTKEYWDNIYERDKNNFEDHGDVGEIWFGEDSELRILRWLTKNNIPTDKRIIDLGCGNGMMLVELAREGYNNVTGVDYCESAIELSKSIIDTQSMGHIKLEVADLTQDCNLVGFDIVLDKGTFDAISLSPDDPKSKKLMYLKNVSKMLNDGGLFVITSCNWTENELVEQFSTDFKHKQTIPTPTFSFGGKTGSVVSSVVFEKNAT
uniref:Protein-lysine N-methyltransferase CM83_54793 n=2 Tax=Lygus hesperus TaxID=30085 RepID=A0A0A9WG81_LYGHE